MVFKFRAWELRSYGLVVQILEVLGSGFRGLALGGFRLG